VTVPNKVWKVILVLDANDNDQNIERVDANTRLIAVIMPNDRSVPQDNWWRYRVSVKEVEELTGYTFFDKVPADIINPLKEEVDAEFIPVLAREH
jgi:endonuclease G, mitochondrial